jgi:hypothetical protein
MNRETAGGPHRSGSRGAGPLLDAGYRVAIARATCVIVSVHRVTSAAFQAEVIRPFGADYLHPRRGTVQIAGAVYAAALPPNTVAITSSRVQRSLGVWVLAAAAHSRSRMLTSKARTRTPDGAASIVVLPERAERLTRGRS